ncbi:hypothetical protein [uncultured Parasphingorhabdus sp.]|uniref:hypothetical protein n=1 Tax=uncultured Parasphingorhabdus sp. TaxID=2709694 RepID=UPI0030D9A199|tara:strand:- start:5307 stop:5837 length:531 start_codon:yes stop_codon:yes gene_type:complete
MNVKSGFTYLLRIVGLVALFFAASFSVTARADVNVTFYSHDFGKNFPHAFFVAKGELSDGKKVDTAFGFTAINVSPGILFGSVNGHVKAPSASYIASSNPHFTVKIDDGKYRKLMAVVQKWQAIPQKSYSLNKRNCVHFINDVIKTLDLKTNLKTANWKKPRSFMEEVMKLNPFLK